MKFAVRTLVAGLPAFDFRPLHEGVPRQLVAAALGEFVARGDGGLGITFGHRVSSRGVGHLLVHVEVPQGFIVRRLCRAAETAGVQRRPAGRRCPPGP